MTLESSVHGPFRPTLPELASQGEEEFAIHL